MRRRTILSFALVVLFAVAGCDLMSGGTDSRAPVGVQFQTVTSETGTTSRIASSIRGAGKQLTTDSLVVEGTNGTLIIRDVRFIVSEFELKRSEAACPDSLTDDDDCEEFEGGMTLVDLPLDGSGYDVTGLHSLPGGTYTGMQFNVEDVGMEADEREDKHEEDDVEDREEQAQLDSLRQAITAAGFSDWPNEASMVVIGEFIKSGHETGRNFQTFIDAEVEVEIELDPPLEVSGGESSRSLVVQLDPGRWFTRVDGQLRNLSAHTEELIELEVEFEDGIMKAKIESEREKDRDDDKDDADDGEKEDKDDTRNKTVDS